MSDEKKSTCPFCHGDGKTSDGVMCQYCDGTGKVSADDPLVGPGGA